MSVCFDALQFVLPKFLEFHQLKNKPFGYFRTPEYACVSVSYVGMDY